MDVPGIIALLVSVDSTSVVTNQYRRDGPRETSAVDRLARVEEHLRARDGASVVVVGEAAGWRGARQTGVAFTSPAQVAGSGMSEASATAVRAVLVERDMLNDVLLWNAFPWHPHPAGSPHANRAPTAREVRLGLPLLRLVLGDRGVLAVGRRAAAAVGECLGRPVPDATAADGERALAVRHPSFGGQQQFQASARTALPQLRASVRRPPAALEGPSA